MHQEINLCIKEVYETRMLKTWNHHNTKSADFKAICGFQFFLGFQFHLCDCHRFNLASMPHMGSSTQVDKWTTPAMQWNYCINFVVLEFWFQLL